MAIGGANISRGMNRGAAQVYDTSSPVNTYAKLLQQQQLKREKETKLLEDELSKVSPEGIRQADIPEFTTKYQEAKDIFGLRQGVKDPNEKIKYDREYAKKMLELKQIASDSKALGKGEQEFTKMLLNPNVRERFVPDAVDRFQKSKTLSRNDQNFLRDLTTLEHRVDGSKVMKAIQNINEAVLSKAKSTTELTPAKVGNMSGTYMRTVASGDPKEQAAAIGMQYDVDPEFKAGLLSIMPKEEGETDESYKARAIPEIVSKFPAVKYGEEKFRANQRPRVSGGGGGGGGSNPSDYTVEKDTYLYTKPKGYNRSGKKIAGGNEKSIRMVKSVGFDTDYFPLIDAQAFDVENRKKDAKVSGNFIVGKLAYVPLDSGMFGLRAVVVNSDGNTYVVKPDILPIGIRKSANYKAAIKALGEAPKAQTLAPQSQPQKAAETNAPKAGTIENGYKFKGGDPAKPENWEKVNEPKR